MKTIDNIHLEEFKERQAYYVTQLGKAGVPVKQQHEIAYKDALADMVDEIHVMLRKLLSKS